MDDSYPRPVSDPAAGGIPEYADDDSTAKDDVDSPREADGPDPYPLPLDRDDGAQAINEYGTTPDEQRRGEPAGHRPGGPAGRPGRGCSRGHREGRGGRRRGRRRRRGQRRGAGDASGTRRRDAVAVSRVERSAPWRWTGQSPRSGAPLGCGAQRATQFGVRIGVPVQLDLARGRLVAERLLRPRVTAGDVVALPVGRVRGHRLGKLVDREFAVVPPGSGGPVHGTPPQVSVGSAPARPAGTDSSDAARSGPSGSSSENVTSECSSAKSGSSEEGRSSRGGSSCWARIFLSFRRSDPVAQHRADAFRQRLALGLDQEHL